MRDDDDLTLLCEHCNEPLRDHPCPSTVSRAAPELSSHPALAPASWLDGAEEYLDWLINKETFAAECGNEQARDAYSQASSELMMMLARKEPINPEKTSNATEMSRAVKGQHE